MIGVAERIEESVTGRCPKCQGFLSTDAAEEDELAVCLNCSYRIYGIVDRNIPGRFTPKGARAVLEYMGDVGWMRGKEALAFLTGRRFDEFTASTGGDHGLRYMVLCPFCNKRHVIDEEDAMRGPLMLRRGKSSTHTWECEKRHSITVIRSDKRELLGWR